MNMFERMDIDKNIYEVILEPSLKTKPGKDPYVPVTAGR